MSELALTDIHKGYGGHSVLSGLDLNVPSGSMTALLGPSGIGKTTLLRLLAGFDSPDLGTIRIGTTVVSNARRHVPPEKRRVGYVPQEGSLFPHLTAVANVGFGLPRRERAGRSRELLEQVGLSGLERRYPHELSGGQQQRVALARALATQPEVVLLDEPFAALDENLRDELRTEVRRILADAGTTTVLVTHNQDEALSTADRIAVIRDGRVIQHAAPRELYLEPVDRELADFLGPANFLPGMLRADGTVQTPLGVVAAARSGNRPVESGQVTTLLRPEQITLSASAGPDGHPARVVRQSFYGHDTLFLVELERAGRLAVRATGPHLLSPGDSCYLAPTGPAVVWPVVGESGLEAPGP